MASSYNGWPASPYPSRIGINTSWEPIPGHRFPGGIKSGDVQTVMTYLVRQLDARVEPIEMYRPGDEWGWFYKYSANSPYLLSCHGSGTAIDYNAVRHPNGVRGTWTSAQVREIREILAECGVVRWLYDSTRTPDEMHFEIRGTPYDVMLAARRLKGLQPPAPQPPVSGEFTMDAAATKAFNDLTNRVNELAFSLAVAIKRLDDDIPANLPDILRELRVNERTAIQAVNDLRAKEGLPPLDIVIGYTSGGEPIHATD